MNEEKRAVRSYKAKQTPYVKASERARKEHTTVANLLELFVEMYAEGAYWNYSFTKKNKVIVNGRGTK